MFEKLKLWLESPVDKNDFFGSNIRELYQTFKLVFGKTPEGPVCERKMTPEEQAAWDEEQYRKKAKEALDRIRSKDEEKRNEDLKSYNDSLIKNIPTEEKIEEHRRKALEVLNRVSDKTDEKKIVVDRHDNLAHYDDVEFLLQLKMDLTTKIAFLGSNAHHYSDAQEYIERYLDIIAVIDDAINISEVTDEIFKKSVLINEVPKNEEIQKLVNVLKDKLDTTPQTAPTGTPEAICKCAEDAINSENVCDGPVKLNIHTTERTLDEVIDLHNIDRRHEMAPASASDVGCACNRPDLSDCSGCDSSGTPEPTPMPCPSVFTPFLPKVLTDDDHQHIVHDEASDVPAFEPSHESYMEHVDPHGRFEAHQQMKKDMDTLTARKVPVEVTPSTPAPVWPSTNVVTPILDPDEQIIDDHVPYNENETEQIKTTARKI